MRVKFRPRFLILSMVLLLIAGLVVAVSLFSGSDNSRAGLLKAQSTGYSFRFATVTQGTNHVVFSGTSVIAKLKWRVYHSSFRPLRLLMPRNLRAERYAQVTPAAATLLWVGWTHRDYKSTLREGIPQPSAGEFGNLDAFLVGPSGKVAPLRITRHNEAPFVKEFMTAYDLSEHSTNLIGGVVVLRQHETQEDVASFQFQ